MKSLILTLLIVSGAGSAQFLAAQSPDHKPAAKAAKPGAAMLPVTDDLFTHAAAKLKDIQLPANVHFTEAGSEYLADKVVAAITAALADSPGTPK